MKLEHAILVAAALALGGCASSAPAAHAPLVPMTDAVSTTTITSALEADEQETPKVGKAQRSLDGDSQMALEPKKTASREGKRQHAFADWK